MTTNGRPAILGLNQARGVLRVTAQTVPEDGIRAANPQTSECPPGLRYPAFEAVTVYRIAKLRRLELVHPHSFRIVTPVAVTDRARSRIRLGSAYYQCNRTRSPGTSCTDRVAWRGKIILTFNVAP